MCFQLRETQHEGWQPLIERMTTTSKWRLSDSHTTEPLRTGHVVITSSFVADAMANFRTRPFTTMERQLATFGRLPVSRSGRFLGCGTQVRLTRLDSHWVMP